MIEKQDAAKSYKTPTPLPHANIPIHRDKDWLAINIAIFQNFWNPGRIIEFTLIFFMSPALAF
jgi:hypothetical protein